MDSSLRKVMFGHLASCCGNCSAEERLHTISLQTKRSLNCAQTKIYPLFQKVIEKVVEGYRMTPPENTPPEIADLMKKCWEEDPDSRPTFKVSHGSSHMAFYLTSLHRKCWAKLKQLASQQKKLRQHQ